MIYIEKSTINKVVLTLSEKTTLNSPFFLFIFKNEFIIDSNAIAFTTPDISSYTNRYNLFSIEESDNGSTNGGNDIPLSLTSGQYEYIIYESNIETLNVEETTGIPIEIGRMVVSGCDDNIEIVTDSVYQ